jgi:hypothetical protein
MTWAERSIEQKTLFNPAFLALIIFEASRGHHKERDAPLPFALAFLAVALSTHDEVVDRLPTIATSMYTWINRYPLARAQIAERSQDLVSATREALRVGANSGLLNLHASGSIAPGSHARGDATARRLRTEPNLKGAYFIGRWLARAGDPVTVLDGWGLSV